jgi:glutamyl-tRNA reductase
MNSTTSTFYVVGISYKKADAQTRGKFSISPENQKRLIEKAAKNGNDGLVVVSTCNRTELIGFAMHPFKLIRLMSEFWEDGTVDEFAKYSYVVKSKAAIDHLFRMATGLDSQILGDYEIVGQLKTAYKTSKELGTINTFMERLFSHVFQASKKVKNETTLSSGTTSVAYAATQYLNSYFSNLENESILVYGFGDIGQHTVQNLYAYTNCKNISVVNRSAITINKPELEKSKVYPHEKLQEAIDQSTILIVATGAPKPTITAKHITPSKTITILDLSVPNNVVLALGDNSNTTLVGIDVLSKITEETIENRKQQVPLAEQIIDLSTEEFINWIDIRKFTPAINSLKDTLELLRQHEISLQKVNGDAFSQEQVEKITTRMVHKITTQFAKHLRANTGGANKSIDLMYKVFDIVPSQESGL